MSAPSPARKPVRLFYSYSHKDEKLRQNLDEHLSNLQRQGLIEPWHDRKIVPGTEWKGQIDEHLEKADIILLLVSRSFMASDYCQDVEVTGALQRHAERSARVIPVILSPVDWRDSPIGKLQALPKDGKPVTTWRNRDEALLDITAGIKRAIQELENPTVPRGPAGRNRRALQSDVSKLCNREEQEQDFVDFCEDMMRLRPGVPQIYVVPGERLDRHDMLVQRLFRTKIPKRAEGKGGARRVAVWEPVIETERLEYTDLKTFQKRLARNLYEKAEDPGLFEPARISADRLAGREQWRLHAMVVVQHDLESGSLADDLPAFLRWYVNEFWQGVRNEESGPQFLIFMNVIYPEAREQRRWGGLRSLWRKPAMLREGVRERLAGVLPQSPRRSLNEDPNAAGCPCLLLRELAPVELRHVERWFEDRFPDDSISEGRRQAKKVYEQAERGPDGALRMDGLERSLRNFWEESVR